MLWRDTVWKPGGGPLFDMGPYYITAMINLLGGVKSVYGYGHISYAERLITAKEHYGEIIKVNTPTHIESIITLENGKNVSLLTSFDIYSSKQANIEIYGTKGTLYVPDPNTFGGEVVFYNGEEKKEYRYKSEEHFDYYENSRLLGLADMAKAIEAGRDGRTTYKQTLHVLEIMDSVLKSARTGKVIELKSKYERTAPMDAKLPHGIL